MTRGVLTGLILAMALPALDLMALGAAGPAVAGELGRVDQIAWLFVTYQLALVVSVPIYGKLGDLRGRRLVFSSAVSIFTVSSLVAGSAWSFTVLLAARVAQGLGGGGIVSQTHAVIADLVPARERGRYSWVTPTVWTVMSFAGPVFGGALAEHASWRWIFLLNLPFGAASLWFVRDAFPVRVSAGSRRFDLPGAALLLTSYGSLVFAVSVAGDLFAWSDPRVLGPLVGGGVLLVVFVVHELRTDDPVLPLRLLTRPVVGAAAATTAMIGSVNFLAVAFLPLMLQMVLGVGATAAGLAILPTTLGITVASTVVGRLVTRTGHYRGFPILGSAVFAAGYAVLGWLGPHPSMATVWLGTLLLGIGMGCGTPVFMLAMQNAVPHRDVGVVSAMAMFARNTGQAFGVAAAGSWFVTRLSGHLDASLTTAQRAGLAVDEVRGDVAAVRALEPGLRDATVDAFRLAAADVFRVGAVVGALSVVAAAMIPQTRLRETLEVSGRE